MCRLLDFSDEHYVYILCESVAYPSIKNFCWHHFVKTTYGTKTSTPNLASHMKVFPKPSI